MLSWTSGPNRRKIPFCSYNSVGYREQVAGALMAEAHERVTELQ
jgi:uncharacterized radical SAM superfamily Fe-S cluster-containing enzyme